MRLVRLRCFAQEGDDPHPAGMQADTGGDVARERAHHAQQHADRRQCEKGVEYRQRLGQLFGKGRTLSGNQRRHGGVARQQIRKHRQQAVARVLQFALAHVQIQHAQELGVAAGIGHQRDAASVFHRHRLRQPAGCGN
mgnify:CR=1 FL=1